MGCHLHFPSVNIEGLSATAENAQSWISLLDSNVFDLCSENVNREAGPKKRSLFPLFLEGHLQIESLGEDTSFERHPQPKQTG